MGDPATPRTPGAARIMWRMLGLARPFAPIMALAVILGVLGAACATAVPTGAAYLVACLATGTPLPAPLPAAVLGLAILAIARGVAHYAEQSCNHYIAFKLLAHIRSRVFGALRRLAPARLAASDRGQLVSTLTSDVELLEVFYAHTISPVAIALAFCAIAAALLARLHWSLALVAAAAYLLVGAVLPLLASRAAPTAAAEGRERQGRLSAIALDTLRGLAEVLQFAAASQRLAALDDESHALRAAQRRISATAGATAAVADALIVLATLAQAALAAELCRAGALAPAAAILATVGTLSSFGPVSALAALATTLQGTLASGRRVIAILDEEPAVDERTDGVDVTFAGASAADVTFAYLGADPVLDAISLDVPEGQVTGIVGKSGSGKSTLLRLFMRFWDARRGRVCVSGERVENVNTACLRSLESLVEQDTFLFRDSIRENLLVARPDATDVELEAACRAASVHDFVTSLPAGLDTPVGELGSTLSGGERQRLGLARAFLHGSPFLLLDEPTSNLDSLNEAAILRSIAEQRGQRTVLLVSHRASTMGIANSVYIMNKGQVS